MIARLLLLALLALQCWGAAPHRYWRIFTPNPYAGDTYLSIAEIEFRDTPGGTNRLSGGTVSANVSSVPYLATQATDGNLDTFWTTYPSIGASAGGWWQYDFGAGVAWDIVEVVVTPRRDGGGANAGQAPVSFVLQYSDNGSTWYERLLIPYHAYGSAAAVTYTLATYDAGFLRHNYYPSGPNGMNSPVVLSASTEGSAAWYALDGRVYVDTGWASTTLPAWWEANCGAGSKYKVTGYSLAATHTNLTATPKAWTFEGSNDHSSWTVLNTQTNQTGWAAGDLRVYAVTGAAAYQYLRVNVSAVNGGSTVHIGEVSLIGTRAAAGGSYSTVM